MAGDIDVELEGMRKEDYSWHPCQVSLCPDGAGLVVLYENDGFEDILVSEKEALVRLRVRSLPLRGDDCTHIEHGEHVLATRKSQPQSPFFDAEVEKAVRVRHSKRVHCRCTFVLKWLHQDLKGRTLIVPSSSIMKLADRSINTHPTISAFLNGVRTSGFSSMLPLPTVVNDMDLDLHELLEKQIEGIRNSVDASKNKNIDAILGFEVHTKERVKGSPIDVTNASESNIRILPDQNHLRRSTRSRKKLQTEIEVMDPPTPTPSIQEELSENRSPLNPLAARAALASLMSNSPQNFGFSFYHKGEKCFTNSPDVNCHAQDTMHSLSLTEYYSSSAVSDFCILDNLSSKAESVSVLPKPDSIVKSLFSTGNASGERQLLDVSSTVLIKEGDKGHKNPEVTDFSASFTCLTEEKNMCQPRIATRLTRAAVKNVTCILDDNIERRTIVDEKKLRSATNSRFTRSAIHKEEERQTIETRKVFEDSTSAKCRESNTSDHNVTAKENYALKDKKPLATPSPLDAKIDSLLTAERKSLVKTEQRNKKNEIERRTCFVEIHDLSNIRKLTRSAFRKETANITMETTRGLEGGAFPENGISESSVGHASNLDINMQETKKPVTLPLHADINLPPTEERDKKRQTSKETESMPSHVESKLPPTGERAKKRQTFGAVKTTQETEVNVSGDGGSSQGLKRKSTTSKKHEVRFSARLKFLPRTRSRNKA